MYLNNLDLGRRVSFKMECGEAVTTEDVLAQLGEFGRCQKLILLLLFVVLIPCHYQLYVNQILLETPSWTCVNDSLLCPFNNTLPSSDKTRCDIPREEWYYTEDNKYSLVTHLQLDCEREWFQGVLTTLLYGGVGVGAVMLGWLSDVRGRKYVLFHSFFILLMVSFMSAFIYNIHFLLVARFFTGFFYPGVFLPVILVVVELFNKMHRSGVLLFVLSSIPVSSLLLLLQAYFCRQWRIITIVCSLPYTAMLLFYILVPESVRWLQSRDRSDDVMKILKKMTSWNRRRISRNMLVIQDSCSHREVVKNMKMFRRPVSALKIGALTILWSAIYMQYHRDSLVIEEMGTTVYEDMLIFNGMEVPVRLFAIFVCNILGHKKSVVIPLFLSTLSFLIVPSISHHMKIMTLIIGTIGKLSVTISASTVFSWSVELRNVEVRGRMCGLFYLMTIIIPITTPWMDASMKQFGRGYLCFVIAAVSMVACCLSMCLPDVSRKDCVSRVHMVPEDDGEYQEQIRLTKHVTRDAL